LNRQDDEARGGNGEGEQAEADAPEKTREPFIFDNQASIATPTAISVLGTSGRVKVWRYNTNGNTYSE